eukprot:Nitzschia sp. Nitz4//scaffold11_size288233//64490//65310//NITZ4_000747-RA/size288233-snap-gene-0.9-mRNA-1//1//CDS//3329533993//948//frame0
MTPAPGQEEPLKRMAKIVNSFLARNDIAPFAEPVDWRGLELYDYPKIIDKMMDLGTVKRRLERGQYQTAHQVAEDIRLVWNNCMTYNADGSDFWLLAKSYLRRFEDRYRKVRNEFDVGEEAEDESNEDEEEEEVKPPTPASSTYSKSKRETVPSSSNVAPPVLDARVQFGANLFSLSGKELGIVMTDLECKCPEALETWGDAKVEVNVDAIPAEIFHRLHKYVSGLVDNKPMEMASEAEIPKKKRRKS